MTNEKEETARVVAPPPLIYVAGLLVGWLFDRAVPAAILPPAWQRGLGWLLIVIGLVGVVWAIVSMARVKTSVNPYAPTSAIATSGPYRFSRNPIYLFDILIYLGACALINSLWPLVLLPGVIWVMRVGVIDREERYLERRFGEKYLRYKRSVRRWL
jgi:protein-S-isoprenylcysteine O-methyltransferase Ste14